MFSIGYKAYRDNQKGPINDGKSNQSKEEKQEKTTHPRENPGHSERYFRGNVETHRVKTSFDIDGVIIALGVSSNGKKYVLGIYQASSENHQSCLNLLNDLESRGLPTDGLLFVVDGGSGLNKALNLKYQCDDKQKKRAIRIRCHIHKWRNIEKALGDDTHKAKGPFWALRDAEDMVEAKMLSDQLESILRNLNKSALESSLDAKDDLLAMHDLKLSRNLKKFFSTTNPIESLNSLLEEDMRRVKHWKNSEHFQRWLATFCLHNEKRMRRVRGYRGLPALWVRIREITKPEIEIDLEQKVG